MRADLPDPASAWKRYENGAGPMHELTVTIARVLHNTFRSDGSIRKSWDEDVVTDQWLAVGSWQAAERVVAVLPMVVKP